MYICMSQGVAVVDLRAAGSVSAVDSVPGTTHNTHKKQSVTPVTERERKNTRVREGESGQQ